MGNIINGKEVASNVKEQIVEFVNTRIEQGKKRPQIASILVGDDGGSIFYLNSQEKIATSLGLLFKKIILDKNTTEYELLSLVEELNNDKDIHGIMLQVPLPKHINEKKVVNKISPLKDIDCLSSESVGKLYLGEEGFIPCTPNSVVTLLKSLKIDLCGKNAVVLGRSNIVGKPVAQ